MKPLPQFKTPPPQNSLWLAIDNLCNFSDVLNFGSDLEAIIWRSGRGEVGLCMNDQSLRGSSSLCRAVETLSV